MNQELKAIHRLNRVLHEPGRMVIMALLYGLKAADYLYLATETGMTKGNLTSHLAKLEEAGYIQIVKGYKGKVPHTLVELTDKGRSAFNEYRAELALVSSGLRRAEENRPV